MQIAAIYARVSSDQQRESHTIASQTAALVSFAEARGYSVPAEWIFEDAGYSGATLLRPGLERIRDLVAEGQIQAVLVLSPDRLSRKYAYQILLIEEWQRQGVSTIFVNAPQSERPEDQLLLQFQGMIAEYERAQILERSRRGKRHRAKQGEVSVLGGAPYGYRYIRKTHDSPACYEVDPLQAEVVGLIFNLYTRQSLSIADITRQLNDRGIPTLFERSLWERSTVWGMLNNPAYSGMAYFGKTREATRRQAGNRSTRLRGNSSKYKPQTAQDTPKDQWIGIPVPAIVSQQTFDLAQERLESNKRLSPRRTLEASILQGLTHCAQCGYALYRTSTKTSARKIFYYRCLGSDAWRYQGKARCNAKPIRLDLLEATVWTEVEKLIEDPSLIQSELNRRLEAAKNADPVRMNEERIRQELTRVERRMERLLTAYQEELLTLDEFRGRIGDLRTKETRLKAELEGLTSALVDRASYLHLAHTLGDFLARLRERSHSLEVKDKQKILRLLVKEVVVGHDSITIKHSIPTTPTSTRGATTSTISGGNSHENLPGGKSYLLCTGSDHRPLRGSLDPRYPPPVFDHACLKPIADQSE